MLVERARHVGALDEASTRARRLGRPILASWTRPCAVQDAIGLFAGAAGSAHRAVWLRPSSSEALVAIGCARSLLGSGAARSQQISAAWRDLTKHAVIDDASGGPLLVGGFSFDPVQRPSRVWNGFPDARMIVPEHLYTFREGGARLTTSVVVEPEVFPARAARRAVREDQAPLSPAEWRALIGSVARGIRDGHLGVDKVVLARTEQVRTRRPLEAALRELAATYPTCTVFGIAHGDACFVGATPERLISLHAGVASTMALAGSAPRGVSAAEDERLAEQLLTDPKERAEHAVVVAALAEGMAQVCTRVHAGVEPGVEKLSNVQHLLTPLRGQVAAGRTVLDLVEQLHPTPAVGGYPREPALELIRQHEALDRGWYAGPIGWMNHDGDGEFVVALRSGLVRGQTATLFAGCGIVADSDPDAEAAEWGWKLQPMRAALGVEP